MNPVELRKWREAHPGIVVSDDAVSAVGSFPSLFANDLADKLSTPYPDISAFVRALGKECVWAYGNWAAAQHHANEAGLLRSLFYAASGSGEGDPHAQYGFVQKFLIDYAAAHNLPNPSAVSQPKDDWSERLGLGTLEMSSPAGNATTQDPAARPMGGEPARLEVFAPSDEKSEAA